MLKKMLKKMPLAFKFTKSKSEICFCNQLDGIEEKRIKSEMKELNGKEMNFEFKIIARFFKSFHFVFFFYIYKYANKLNCKGL